MSTNNTGNEKKTEPSSSVPRAVGSAPHVPALAQLQRQSFHLVSATVAVALLVALGRPVSSSSHISDNVHEINTLHSSC